MKHYILRLLIGLLLPATLSIASQDGTMATRILTATPARTVLAADFDVTAMTGMRVGGGAMVAIAGQGTPSVSVLGYELGEPIGASLSVAESEIAANAEDLVRMDSPAIMHDLRVVNLHFRQLFREANGMIRHVRSVEAEVVTDGAGGTNALFTVPSRLSSAFYPLYRMFISNLDELYPEIGQNAPGRYLVIGTQSRINSIQSAPQFQSWLDLKKRKGYTMQLIGVTSATPANVKQAIQQAYDDAGMPPLEYLAIIGDHTEIPGHDIQNPEHATESSVGDNYYSRLAGNDTIPDVIYGRISGQSPSEYATYFAKEFGYESNPYRDDMAWFRSGTFCAGNYNDTGSFPVTPVWNTRWARERLMRDGCISNADTFYWHCPTCGDPPAGQYEIAADLDTGSCIMIYRGWAAQQTWWYPVFDWDRVRNLENGRKLPAVWAIVCGSGDYGFTNGPCLGEMMTSGVGSPQNPSGAITFFGASDVHTNTKHNNAILAGIIESQMTNGLRSAGAVGLAGRLEGWRQFVHNDTSFFYIMHVFNLLGDPETQLYLCEPQVFDLYYPGEVSQGVTLIEVTTGVADAVVTIRQQGSETVSAVRTDAGGMAWVPVNFTSAGTAQLTVWKSGYFLERRDITITSAAFDPQIAGVTWIAGSDNLPNPGETANFTLTVRNVGTQPAAYTITISDCDERLAPTGASATVPTLAPGETGTSTSFTVQLQGEFVNGERPLVSLHFTDGTNGAERYMVVPVAAPDPVVVSLRVDDANGILEAGESRPVYVTIRNVGGTAADGLTAVASSFDNAISFPSSALSWPAIAVGQSAESPAPFTASLAGGVTPGRQVLLRLDYTQGGATVAHKTYPWPTGVVTINAPTGPDEYGYYAYENIDAGYSATPTYNWIELDPNQGGNGTVHQVTDEFYFTVPLPQPFTYYGQTFSNIWICSNGWFSFEATTLPEFRNWELPSPLGAPSLVAAFWDDLVGKTVSPPSDTVFNVFTRYDDAEQDRLIIEWRALNRRGLYPNPGFPNNAVCVFEAILEYPAQGDGSILLQYNQIANIDSVEAYATVGIEDSYHRRGLNLTYANVYPPSMDLLQAGRAIRITTQPPDGFNPVDDPVFTLPVQFALHEAYPNPFNPSTVLSFDLPEASRISLRVYDLLGREVALITEGFRAAGRYNVSFSAEGLPTGLYFARLEAGSHVAVRKLMLVK